jgi:hypothetical protein
MHYDIYLRALHMLKAREQLHFSNYKNRFRCVIFIDSEKANFYYSQQPLWQTANKRAELIIFLFVFGMQFNIFYYLKFQVYFQKRKYNTQCKRNKSRFLFLQLSITSKKTWPKKFNGSTSAAYSATVPA